MSKPVPPPPPGAERRKHPRIELVAQLEVQVGGEVMVVPVSNISAGGVLVDLDSSETENVWPRDAVKVFLSGDIGGLPLQLSLDARVVRIDRGQAAAGAAPARKPTVALAWVDRTATGVAHLERALARLVK